jgi:hypothetical protein
LVNPRLFVERKSIAENIHKSITGLYVIRASGMSPVVAGVVQIFKTQQKAGQIMQNRSFTRLMQAF